MKKFSMKLLLSLAGISLILSACSESLEKGIDNYFKEYAVKEYNDSDAVPFYSVIKNPDLKNSFYTQSLDNHKYSSVISAKETDMDYSFSLSDLDSEMECFVSDNSDYIYDVFGNSLYTGDTYYIEARHQYAFLSTKTENPFFSQDLKNPKIILFDVVTLECKKVGSTYTICKPYDDEYFDFEKGLIDSESKSCLYYVENNKDYGSHYSFDIERLNDYEYVFCYSGSEKHYIHYYINKDDSPKTNTPIHKYEYTIDSSYYFYLNYPKFQYTFSVESVYEITNDFDFYIDDSFAKTYHIDLPSGNYKITSTHPSTFFPIEVFVSSNHDYAYCLCAKIGKDKRIEPGYYALKLDDDGKISKFHDDVELMLGIKRYLTYNGQYDLLGEDESLVYLNPKLKFYIKRNDDNTIIIAKDFYEESGRRFVACFPEEKEMYFIADKYLEIYQLSDGLLSNDIKTRHYKEMYDSINLLYSDISNNLYFQNTLIDKKLAVSSVQRDFWSRNVSLSHFEERIKILNYDVYSGEENTSYTFVCRGAQ